MEKPSFKLVGAPCGHHGQYTFYKAIRLTGEQERILAIGDFFFVRIWQDSELVSVGELQLLWTDRVSDQTLVSLRLYFLPENTPDGRNLHGEDEVLAINDKVVLRAEDLLSWICNGEGWRWGLRAVWRGACAPPADKTTTTPLHHTRLDFTDVEHEKNAIVDPESSGVVVFSYPRYCRYRALVSRLEGIQGDWLRDSFVAALGGYAAPTKNTRILYCKDTFEYPELEGHEFVCNHLAPKLKGRGRGRRRRAPRAGSPSPSPSPEPEDEPEPATPRRLSLRNGGDKRSSSSEDEKPAETAEDRAFTSRLRHFYRQRNETLHAGNSLKDLSLRALYEAVVSRGGYEAVCRHKLWRVLFSEQPARTRRLYERFLLPYENHARRLEGGRARLNGRLDEPRTVATIDVTHSPPPPAAEVVDSETGEVKEELELVSRPAEELNREFLASLPDAKPRIAVKPVQKLIEPSHVKKLFEDAPPETKEEKCKPEAKPEPPAEAPTVLNLGSSTPKAEDLASRMNGRAPPAPDQPHARVAGRSSLRAVRVKPTRAAPTSGATIAPVSSASSVPGARTPPALTNFGIHHPHHPAPPHPPHPQHPAHPARPERDARPHSDDEIVEVPYKPKTPEIIDLDEYPESPQSIKKKKLDILKERGLEVTAVPAWPLQPPVPPSYNPRMLINPAMQHLMTQAQLFQMQVQYNMIPQSYNGLQPPKVIQGTSLYGTQGPEKTVYGNPKDPFMPPPHILHGTPVKATRNMPSTTTPQDVLDLTCDVSKPAVEIVRIPNDPSPSKVATSPQNLAKNYTLIDGKAVVGSNLEITLVNPRVQTPSKKVQKRSSNGKFMSCKTPPKEAQRQFPSPSGLKKNPIVVPSYQISRDNVSPTSSTGSRDSQSNNSILTAFKPNSLAQIMEMQKSVPTTPFMDPVYMSALYSSLGQMDQRQLDMYRDQVANQFRYSSLLNMGVANTPTTKN